ncbi:MAG TPA: hypothetical protein VGP09_01245 [Caballeronia sp.]|jgi:hypothetical protein|nr:hypothetical protein [Caballeronia sp.]
MKTDGVPVSPALFARLETLGVGVPRTLRAAGLPAPAMANAEPGRLRLTTRKYFAEGGYRAGERGSCHRLAHWC